MSKIKVIEKTREKIVKVANELESFVCATMGPSGQNIALHNEIGLPVITKDGVSVAKVFDCEEPEENLIAQILEQAAEKTNEEAGDGTSTSIAIASSLIKEGNKLIAAGHDVNKIRKCVEEVLPKVKNILKQERVLFSNEDEKSIMETLYKVAMISTNGDKKVSELISEAVAKAGKNGLVIAKKGGINYKVSESDGMLIPNSGVVDYGYIKGSLDKKLIMNKCHILITTYELESPGFILDLQEKVINPIRDKGESLLIIAKKADKGFLANMINNNAKGTIRNAIVRPPYFGSVGREMMDDLAAFTGGIVFDDSEGHLLSNAELKHLGYAEEIEVNPHHTKLFKPRTDQKRLDVRIGLLEKNVESLKNKKDDKDKARERLAALSGKVYNIKVPSTSEIEDKERMDRIDDAINSCTGALEEGYLAGGGMALLRARTCLNTEDMTENMLWNVLEYPFRKIMENAGHSPDVILSNLDKQKEPIVYDARSNKYGLPLELSLIDSYKVVERSLSNGMSVGMMLLTTIGILAEKPQEMPANPYDMMM